MAADHYQTLHVHRHATLQEIHDAYLRLVRAHHPDLNLADPHAVDRFKQIQQAYEVLSNRPARMRYDRALRTELNSARWRTDPGPRPLRNLVRWSSREPQPPTDPFRLPVLLRPQTLFVTSALLVSLLVWFLLRTERLGGQRFRELQHDGRDVAAAQGTDLEFNSSTEYASAYGAPGQREVYTPPAFDFPLDPEALGVLPELLSEANSADDASTSPSSSADNATVAAAADPFVAPAAHLTTLPNEQPPSELASSSPAGAFHSFSVLDINVNDPAYAVLKPPAAEGGTSMSDRLEQIIRDQQFELEERRVGYDWSLGDKELTPAINAWEREQRLLERNSTPASLSGELQQSGSRREDSWSATSLGAAPANSSTFETTSLGQPPADYGVRRSVQPPPWLHDPIGQTPVSRTMETPLAGDRGTAPPGGSWSTSPSQPALANQPALGSPAMGPAANSFFSISREPIGLGAPHAGSPFAASPSEAMPAPRASTRSPMYGSPTYGGALRSRANEMVPASIPTPWGVADAALGPQLHRTRSAFENIDRRIVPRGAPNGMFTTPFGAMQRAQAEAELRDAAHARYEEEP